MRTLNFSLFALIALIALMVMRTNSIPIKDDEVAETLPEENENEDATKVSEKEDGTSLSEEEAEPKEEGNIFYEIFEYFFSSSTSDTEEKSDEETTEEVTESSPDITIQYVEIVGVANDENPTVITEDEETIEIYGIIGDENPSIITEDEESIEIFENDDDAIKGGATIEIINIFTDDYTSDAVDNDEETVNVNEKVDDIFEVKN